MPVRLSLWKPAELGDSVATAIFPMNPARRAAKVRTATIHNTKGETLEAVMLVSHPDKHSQGGHFTHWLDGAGNREHQRFAYVACSRPEHLLIVAAKEMTQAERDQLTGIGLVPVSSLESDINPIGQEVPKTVAATPKKMTAAKAFTAAG